MSRRVLRGGMIVLGFAVGLLVVGSGTAEAADGGLWLRAWRWMVSAWAKAGPEIDPNGAAMETPPPAPPTAPPPASAGSTGGKSTYRTTPGRSLYCGSPATALNPSRR